MALHKEGCIVTYSLVDTRTRPEFRFRSDSGGIWASTGFGPVPVDLAGTRPVPQFFSLCCIIGFMMSYLHKVPPPVPWLDHVHPSSSQTVSRATLQFPDCITCSPSVTWLYHVLHSSFQTVSRATLEFTNCIMPPPLLRQRGGGAWFHIKYRHFRIIILLAKLICHKFYTLTRKTKLLWY